MNSFRQQNMQKDMNIVGSPNTNHIKQKQEEQVRCIISLCAIEEEDRWYIDSICYHHMFGNKDKFIFLKDKSGKIIFGNGTSTKLLGKGSVDVDIKNT